MNKLPKNIQDQLASFKPPPIREIGAQIWVDGILIEQFKASDRAAFAMSLRECADRIDAALSPNSEGK